MAPSEGIEPSPAPEVRTVAITKENMVQHLLETGLLETEVPARFKPLQIIENHPCANGELPSLDSEVEQVPVIDLSAWFHGDSQAKEKVRDSIDSACRQWGFFQVLHLSGIQWSNPTASIRL